MYLDRLMVNQRSYYDLPKSAFEADFLWKVSLKILNSGIILKTFTHGDVDESSDQNLDL